MTESLNEKLTFNDVPQSLTILIKEVSELKELVKNQELAQPKQEEPERFLTIEQASDFLHLSKATLYSKVSKNEISVMKRGKRLYFSSTELTEYLKKGRKLTNAELEAKANEYLSNSKNKLK